MAADCQKCPVWSLIFHIKWISRQYNIVMRLTINPLSPDFFCNLSERCKMSERCCNYLGQFYSLGSITRLIFRQQDPASSKPFSEPKFYSRCHFFKGNRKLSAVSVKILTIDALPTRPVTSHWDNFAVLEMSDLWESADKSLKVAVS